MQKRIPLQNRVLPYYSTAEELVNTISHGIGCLMGMIVLFLCITKAGTSLGRGAGLVYGSSMILLYGISALYHSLRPGTSKKVLQILDHCSIYLLIAGTYTPILLCVFVPAVPAVGWGLLAVQWGVSVIAIILNAIDLKQYRFFSYTAYVLLGWAILPFWSLAITLISRQGMVYLLAGGISYTLGVILYGIGSKLRWFHSIFHFFVLLGSLLHFIAVYQYVL